MYILFFFQATHAAGRNTAILNRLLNGSQKWYNENSIVIISGARSPSLLIFAVRYPRKNSSSTIGPTMTLSTKYPTQVNSRIPLGYCFIYSILLQSKYAGVICVSRSEIGANKLFSNGAIVTDTIPENANRIDAYKSILHQLISLWRENELSREHLPYSSLLAYIIIPISIGNRMKVAQRKNRRSEGTVFCMNPAMI